MAIKPQTWVCRRKGFTLVEMLAVLVIMGILIIFAVPAAERLMKSGGLSSSAREVSNALGLARQYAITHRRNARVIFAYNSGSLNPSSNLWYIAYTVVVTDPTNSNWDYIGKWDFLPSGAVFLNATPGNTPTPFPAGPYSLDNPNNIQSFSIPYPTVSSGASVTFAYIEFNSTGADSRSDGNTDQITLTEGFLQQNATGPVPFRTSSNYVNIAVDNIVGRIQLTRP